MQVRDRAVVVTGGARGIGLAIATRLGCDGAHIALLDVNEGDLATAKVQLEARGIRVRTYRMDVSAEDDVIATMEQIVGDFGRLDVLVNNAGILRDALLVKVKDGQVVGKMSMAQWRAVLDVNLSGVFLCGREAAERMIRLGNGGVIINISSISRHGNAGQSNYSAAKAGAAALSVVWSQELGRHKIRSVAIAPGGTRTDILAAMRPEMLAKLLAPVPVGRLGEPEEIAATAAFIVANDYVNGTCIEVHGGVQ